MPSPTATDRPNAIVIEGVFDISGGTTLPAGFHDIDDVVRELEEQPGGIERMERARKRLAGRMSENVRERSLALLRLSKGWSQTTLGRVVGATQSQIAKYESGRTSPNVEHLARLAKALRVSSDELLRALGVDDSLVEPHE